MEAPGLVRREPLDVAEGKRRAERARSFLRIAIWRGMKAHVKMADSMERMADAAEMIEKIVRRDGEPRV
jgi:hypothetical protein